MVSKELKAKIDEFSNKLIEANDLLWEISDALKAELIEDKLPEEQKDLWKRLEDNIDDLEKGCGATSREITEVRS